jgi:hypothetical protein
MRLPLMMREGTENYDAFGVIAILQRSSDFTYFSYQMFPILFILSKKNRLRLAGMDNPISTSRNPGHFPLGL